jgi:hypothetical protein
MEQQHPPSPMRLPEILKDQFGALEAVANSSIKLARYAPEDERAMDARRGSGAGVRQHAARGARRGDGVGAGAGSGVTGLMRTKKCTRGGGSRRVLSMVCRSESPFVTACPAEYKCYLPAERGQMTTHHVAPKQKTP